jgi:hypothetical protein
MAIQIIQFLALSFLFLLSGVFYGSWISIGRSFQVFSLSEFIHSAQIPMNNKIITWTTDSAPLDWKVIRKRWQFFNDIRTLISLLSFLLFTADCCKLFE